MERQKASSPIDRLIMGAVAYDQKVVPIWNGFQQYFRARGLEFDYVLYSNYERQVEAHVCGHVHIAWNSPLAWLQAERVAKTSAAVRRRSACATRIAT
jgi:phosphonate transport system substrate-binding protein